MEGKEVKYEDENWGRSKKPTAEVQEREVHGNFNYPRLLRFYGEEGKGQRHHGIRLSLNWKR